MANRNEKPAALISLEHDLRKASKEDDEDTYIATLIDGVEIRFMRNPTLGDAPIFSKEVDSDLDASDMLNLLVFPEDKQKLVKFMSTYMVAMKPGVLQSTTNLILRECVPVDPKATTG